MKRVTIVVLLCLCILQPLSSYRLLYREQLYELYHLHFYQYPERCAENIYWLEQALRADFANPLYAKAKIANDKEWELYRYLFTMHINLKLVEQYLTWGSKHNKFTAFFYNAPWKRQNLESLETAEKLFRYATVYWKEALRWSAKARNFSFLFLEEIQYWHDEQSRIEDGSLNYENIINKHLDKLQAVREQFEAMDENTY